MESDNNDPVVWSQLGLFSLGEGDSKKAEVCSRTAIHKNRTILAAWVNLGLSMQVWDKGFGVGGYTVAFGARWHRGVVSRGDCEWRRGRGVVARVCGRRRDALSRDVEGEDEEGDGEQFRRRCLHNPEL